MEIILKLKSEKIEKIMNEGVLRNPQNSSITGTSLSDAVLCYIQDTS